MVLFQHHLFWVSPTMQCYLLHDCQCHPAHCMQNLPGYIVRSGLIHAICQCVYGRHTLSGGRIGVVVSVRTEPQSNFASRQFDAACKRMMLCRVNNRVVACKPPKPKR
ncbi:hypothetical protein ABBQ38_015007 [Trebouxia sp. C0009 RCD-2024]